MSVLVSFDSLWPRYRSGLSDPGIGLGIAYETESQYRNLEVSLLVESGKRKQLRLRNVKLENENLHGTLRDFDVESI